MHVFKDNAGRAWTLSIHVAAVKRCRAQAGVDLYGLVDDGFVGLGKLLGDPVALVDVLYCLCRDEAGTLGVSDDDFGRAMWGDAIEHAADAFLAELTDFFPDPRVRAGLGKVLKLGREVQDRTLDLFAEKMESVDPDSIARRSIASPGSARASSGSTRRRSRSAS